MDLIKYTWANIMVEVSPGVFRAIDRRDKAHIDTIPGGLEEWTAKVLRQKAFHRWVKQGKILSFHVETELYE